METLDTIHEACNEFETVHKDWASDRARPSWPDDDWWRAFEGVLTAFTVDQIPGALQEVARHADRLCEAQRDFDTESEVSGDGHPSQAFWDTVTGFRNSYTAYKQAPEPAAPRSVRSLMSDRGMTPSAVCRIYGNDWLVDGEWDRPRVEWVQQELDSPGSVTKDHPPKPTGTLRPDFVPMGPSLRARSTKRAPTGPDDMGQASPLSDEDAELLRLRRLCDANNVGWHPAAKVLNLQKKLRAAGVNLADPEGVQS